MHRTYCRRIMGALRNDRFRLQPTRFRTNSMLARELSPTPDEIYVAGWKTAVDGCCVDISTDF